MLSLILSMNEECQIVVQSPCGRTEPFKIDRIVKQGTVLGPQLCKVSTAEYGGDTPGYQLGSVDIKPPIFVDDILNILGNIPDMKDAHQKAILFALRKRMNFGVLRQEFLSVLGVHRTVVACHLVLIALALYNGSSLWYISLHLGCVLHMQNTMHTIIVSAYQIL